MGLLGPLARRHRPSRPPPQRRAVLALRREGRAVLMALHKRSSGPKAATYSAQTSRRPQKGEDMKHGSYSTYTSGCRCRPCKDAAAAYARDYRAGVRTRAPASHGTYSRYTAGCRCPECRAANAEYKRERRESGAAPAVHGRDGYAAGCRCDVCRAGWRDYMRDYRQQQRRS